MEPRWKSVWIEYSTKRSGVQRSEATNGTAVNTGIPSANEIEVDPVYFNNTGGYRLNALL